MICVVFSVHFISLHKYRKDSLRKTATESAPPLGPISLVLIVVGFKHNQPSKLFFKYIEFTHWITSIGYCTLSWTRVVVYNFNNNKDILQKDSIYIIFGDIHKIRKGTDRAQTTNNPAKICLLCTFLIFLWQHYISWKATLTFTTREGLLKLGINFS